MKKLTLEILKGLGMLLALPVALVLVMIVVDHVDGKVAHADPKPGLWQEAVTQADGVTVRVLRDTTGGNFNVCYVASYKYPIGYGDPGAASVAISCVPERKP